MVEGSEEDMDLPVTCLFATQNRQVRQTFGIDRSDPWSIVSMDEHARTHMDAFTWCSLTQLIRFKWLSCENQTLDPRPSYSIAFDMVVFIFNIIHEEGNSVTALSIPIHSMGLEYMLTLTPKTTPMWAIWQSHGASGICFL